MFGRDWLPKFPVVGSLTIAAVMLLTAGALNHYRQQERATQEQHATAPRTADLQPSPSTGAEHQRAPAGSAQAICSDPKHGPESDLCQQWRMAVATEEMAFWVPIQFGAVVVEALAVIGALGAAVAAAWYAKRAANETKRTADIAEDTYLRLERPYLFIKFCDLNYLRDSRANVPFIKFTLANHGKTPAVLHAIAVELVADEQPPHRLPMTFRDFTYEVIEPNGEIAEPRTAELKGGRKRQVWGGKAATRVIFHGTIQYYGPTGNLHSDRFCMRCRENAEGFSLEGGTECNYRTTERARQPDQII